MRLTTQDVREYQQWYESRQGSFALARERALLSHLAEPWPRRQQRLLEIGCGTGVFLESFWQAGFDVTGLDSSPAMLDAARERMGHRCEFFQGKAEHLPFHDKEFDFAVFVTSLEFAEDAQNAVCEAVRVARKGLLIGYLNRHSLYYLAKGKRWCWSSPEDQSMLHAAHWLSLWEVKALVHKAAGPRPCRSRSVLPLPPVSWRGKTPWRQINSLFYPPTMGAFAAIRFDLVGDRPMTPLMAWKSEANPG